MTVVNEAVSVDVDLIIAPRCEHSQHDEPGLGHYGDAKYLILGYGHGLCSKNVRFLLCEAGWLAAQAEGYVFCEVCGEDWWVGSAWRIIHTF